MCEPSCWLQDQIRQLSDARRMPMRQMLKLPGRLINGCNATLNDQSGHLLIPNINISICRAFQEALLSDLQHAVNT